MSVQQGKRPQMDPDPTRLVPPVVVGVDGSSANASAIDWAAGEAARTGRELRLVTTTGVFTAPVPQRTLGLIESFDYGAHYTEVLGRIARRMGDRYPGLRVLPWVRTGDPVTTLVEMSRERGALVVVGKRGLGAFKRVLIGSTSIAVVGRVGGPVVVVPDEWELSDEAAEPIVVGVDFDHDNDPVLEFVFERASALRATVVAVHAWQSPPFVSLTEDERGRRMIDAKRRLEDVLAPWRARWPDTEVRSEQVEGHAAPALLDACEHAGLIALGRRAHEHTVAGLSFGSVARAVLHYSQVPVAVVPSR
jgi:nucleotide-binding universal stress UspA family protein